jgi:hypothetical protein
MTTVGNNGKPRAGRPATAGSRNIGSRLLAIRDNKNMRLWHSRLYSLFFDL